MGSRIRVVLFGVFWVTASCTEPRAVLTEGLTSACALATGIYVSEATLRSKSGDCPRAKAHTRDRFEFDDQGFVSPAAVFIPCSTEQVDCTVTVTCQVLDQEMVFEGELLDDATRLVGVATFSGEGACTSAIYDVAAARP